MLKPFAILISLAMLGCGSSAEKDDFGDRSEIWDALEERTGEFITIDGIAVNNKGGAAIIRGEGVVAYVSGIKEWPASIIRKKIRVKGTLDKRWHIPEAKIDQYGMHSAGASAPQFVIDNAIWKVIE
jgi:hypothetical protein